MIGKIIYWSFLVGIIVIMAVFAICNTFAFGWFNMTVAVGIWSLLFGTYVLIGFWLKLDHARVAAAEQCKEYKYVLNRAWGKKDKEQCLETGIIYGVLGLLMLVGGLLTNVM